MPSIRDHYEQQGATRFYIEAGRLYRNPHEDIVRGCFRQCVQQWGLDISSVLDLACGSGEITLEVKALGGQAVGIDPFTGEAYLERTGQMAVKLPFQEIAQHGLDSGQQFSLICCSYALHLLEPSWLPALAQKLRAHTRDILIISPHKRPDLDGISGLKLQQALYHERVRGRLYRWPQGDEHACN